MYNLSAIPVTNAFGDQLQMAIRLHSPTQILKLAATVLQQGAISIQTRADDSSTKFFRGHGHTDAAVEIKGNEKTLHVSATEFWYTCKGPSSGIELLGARNSVQALFAFFRSQMTGVSQYQAFVVMENNAMMRWEGEAINEYEATVLAMEAGIKTYRKKVATISTPEILKP